MRLDHVSYAAGPDGLRSTAQRLSAELGVSSVDGGVHPRFGTRNAVLPLRGGQYIEVVEVLDHPAADKAPFGQAVRARSSAGGGWLAWVLAVDDLAPIEALLGRPAVDGNRHLPDGTQLHWRQVGVAGLVEDPQLPYFIEWAVEEHRHPSKAGPSEVSMVGLQIAGDRERVLDWLGGETSVQDVSVDWVAPQGQVGLQAVTFASPHGTVRI
jgi:hypothetical protein